MQFHHIALIGLTLATLFFLFIRSSIIKDLKSHITDLQSQVDKLRQVAQRQRDEIEKLIHTAEQERRARQMATMAAAAAKSPAPRPPVTKPKEWKDPGLDRDPFKNQAAADSRPPPANSWDSASMSSPVMASSSPSPAPAHAHHGGGSFDGGGASGDYGRSDSSACSSSSSTDTSSSSDSGSSSSSDSSSSCSSD